mmetsp:Transcript_40328/g.64997  ORF Transcript_40328/g.64997 Transcript_40328/m.64997 type:complete len:255 (+) Transcript_40328:208-972(+)
MGTNLSEFVPRYHGRQTINDEEYVVMQNLTLDFDPAETHIMDVKMGKRTFMESEVTNQKKRMDLLQKMVKACKGEATEEELVEGITKQRYQQFRERMSTSAEHGFRVDAMQIPEANGNSISAERAKKISCAHDVQACFCQFLAGRKDCWALILDRLKALRNILGDSSWFFQHELVGSSILFAFDMSKPGNDRCGIWMIDLAHALPSDTDLNHCSEWVQGNHEEGYLTGLDNLIEIWQGLTIALKQPSPESTSRP